jgi:hypothetical protein
MWIRLDNGDWINIDRAERLYVSGINGAYYINIQIRDETHEWKTFKTEEEAQNYLDERLFIIG